MAVSSKPNFIVVESSCVEAIAYDIEDSMLFIRFTSGKEYRYPDVPRSLYDAFLASRSKGSFFNSEIAEIYPFQ